MANTGGKTGLVRCSLAKACMETEEPQDAQIVFHDALGGTSDKDDSLSQDIPVTICKVIYLSTRITVQRVHREVPPHGIGLPIAGIFHLGAAAIGFDIMAQRRHFVRLMINHHRHRAMFNPGRMGFQSSGSEDFNDTLRRQRGGKIDLGDGNFQNRIAHGTARHPRLATRFRDDAEDPLQRWRPQPFGARQVGEITHAVPYIRA